MKRRLFMLALVSLALGPGTWVRSSPPPVRLKAGVEVEIIAPPSGKVGAVEVTGIWQLASAHTQFGSYSALVALPDNSFLAASDRGMAMRFALSKGQPSGFRLSAFGEGQEDVEKSAADIEALAHDPVTGRIWAAYEVRNMIERREADLSRPRRVLPKEMADWSANKGPEAMTRLAGGRFIMLGEGLADSPGNAFPGLIWQDDPLGGGQPVAFIFQTAEDFRPTDLAALPDGRVLILARRIVFGLPPHFEVALLVADPAEIAPQKAWRGVELARFAPPFPTDNYEGLAVDPGNLFPVTITVISDDNGAKYQRTLLLQLRWDGKLP